MMRSRDKGIPLKKSYTVWIYSIIVAIVLIAFVIVFTKEKTTRYSLETRTIQHIEDADANPNIGPTEVNPDGTVDPETFETHLPLFVIDTNGEEVPDIYDVLDSDTQERVFKDPEVTDPWIASLSDRSKNPKSAPTTLTRFVWAIRLTWPSWRPSVACIARTRSVWNIALSMLTSLALSPVWPKVTSRVPLVSSAVTRHCLPFAVACAHRKRSAKVPA